MKGKAHSGSDSGNGVPINHFSKEENFFRQRRREHRRVAFPFLSSFVTLEKEMVFSGQDLDGLWLYDDYDMGVYLFAFSVSATAVERNDALLVSPSLCIVYFFIGLQLCNATVVYSMRWGCTPRARLGVYYCHDRYGWTDEAISRCFAS